MTPRKLGVPDGDWLDYMFAIVTYIHQFRS